MLETCVIQVSFQVYKRFLSFSVPNYNKSLDKLILLVLAKNNFYHSKTCYLEIIKSAI